MQFNLKHFLSKRNLTLKQWAENHKINSLKDYDEFMLNGEYVNDISLRRELETFFSNNQNAVCEEKNQNEENKTEEKKLEEEEKEESTSETFEKPAKKKRLRVEENPV